MPMPSSHIALPFMPPKAGAGNRSGAIAGKSHMKSPTAKNPIPCRGSISFLLQVILPN